MAKTHHVLRTKSCRKSTRSIHAVDLAELAGVADALLVDGRPDFAAQLVVILYYCADRQIDNDNVIPFPNRRKGYA